MKITLSEIELNRLNKLLLVYLLECGDEDVDSPGGEAPPSAYGVSLALNQQGVDIDIDILQSILDKELAISDELAATIEKEFMFPAGWMSN